MINRTSHIMLAVLIGLGASAATAQPSEVAPNPANSVIARLVGRWEMRGEVRGRPAVYDAVGQWTLGRGYVELHMRDRAAASPYEARVFIGSDTAKGRVVVHWLDNTGAAFSVPAGVGAASGDTLRFEFAYSDAPFRDTFIYGRRTNEWSMILETGDGRGEWRPFATYVARRKP
ncbi:MAG TPA: hypothetical protein VGP84_14275 [Gemmatimonadaceae bacterium]|nr:hypothetical protein [Gemmatimonadaceae bacterium]